MDKLKLALIGYGKMGKVIEKLAIERGHDIVLKISSKNLNEFNEANLADVDVAIEFSMPSKALANLKKLSSLGTKTCLLYTSPSPRDGLLSRMPSSA